VSRPGISSSRRVRSAVFWAGILVTWIILPGITGDWQESPNRWISVLCYATTIQFLLQLWSWKTVSVSLFDPYVIFLTAATLFNAGRTLLAVLPGTSFESPFPPSIALYGLYVVALALCAFHLGGLIAVASPRVRPADAGASLAIPGATMRHVGGWLVLIAIVPMSILMKQAVTAVMREGYGVALYTNEAATSFAATPSVLAAFLVPGAFLLLAGSARRAGLRVTTAIIVAAYSGSLLFIGWRSAAISVAIAYIWLWHRCVRAIPRAAILSFGALLLAIMPAIAAMRNLTGQDRLSFDTFVQSVQDAKGFSAIEEMGGIWETVAHTITLVPAERPYDYGASYGLSTLTVLPNLFWDVHPALRYGSPETWLVRRVAPWAAARGGGLGFSFIAEAYLNFGLSGCVMIIGAMGFLLAKAVWWAEGVEHPLAFALAASALAASVKYVRADSTELVRPLVWYAIGPYLLVLLLAKRKKPGQVTSVASVGPPVTGPNGRAGDAPRPRRPPFGSRRTDSARTSPRISAVGQS
jgi:O-antigen polysaccharide polymerase Wzy